MAGSATPFIMRCSRRGFSDTEIRILEDFGRAFDRLGRGLRQPRTLAQRRFVEVANNRCGAKTFWEKTWRKYLDRLERQQAPVHGARSGPAPRRPAPPTGLPGPRPHYSDGAHRLSGGPPPASSARMCRHGRSALLCDYCWKRETGGSLN